MARIGRIVIPGCPHHLVHRGHRRGPVFVTAGHRMEYRQWLGEYALQYGLHIWAYCLMTNHVHLIVVPEQEDSLALAVGHAHGRYAQQRNNQEQWSGELWAGRFYSVPMDQPHLWAATKYVETNPVRAGMVARAQDHVWSSAAAHAWGKPEPLLSPDRPFPNPQIVGDWADWLAEGLDQHTLDRIRLCTSTGRPLGSQEFVKALEEQTGRRLTPQKRGPKRR